MSIKTFISQSLSNFTKSLSKVFIKKEDIVNNLTSENTDKPQAAYQGKVLGDKIDILNSNKISYGIAIGTSHVLFSAYNDAGIPTSSGVKTMIVVTDSDSMAYGVYIASYVHGSYLNLANILNGGIQASAYNNLGTISWTGQTGTPRTFVIQIA